MAPKSVTFRRHDHLGVCAFWRFAQPFLQHYIFNVFGSCWNTLYLYLSNANINAEAVVAFAISSEPSLDCTLKLNHDPLGYDCLLAILRMLMSTRAVCRQQLGAQQRLLSQNRLKSEPVCTKEAKIAFAGWGKY